MKYLATLLLAFVTSAAVAGFDPSPSTLTNVPFPTQGQSILVWDPYDTVANAVDGYVLEYLSPVAGARVYIPIHYFEEDLVVYPWPQSLSIIKWWDPVNPVPAGTIVTIYLRVYRNASPPGMDVCDPEHWCSETSNPVVVEWPHVCEYTTGEPMDAFIQCVIDAGPQG